MAQDYRVALIAIASNEGAYLAQFVFHHLRMGFAPIILITNNSEDDTAAMAARMAERLPGVHHLDGDPLRSRIPPADFQNSAYSLAFDLIDELQAKPDYAMFLDVDEYWVPLNGDSNVSDYIANHDAPDTLMFNWVVPDFDNTPFTIPCKAAFAGVPLKHLKTIWRYGVSLVGFNAHNVRSPELIREIVVSGMPLERRAITIEAPVHPGSAMVIHQMYRCKTEYVAVLDRGRPSDTLIFKTNRQGYRYDLDKGSVIEIPLDPTHCRPWLSVFPAWVDDIGIRQMLVNARLNVVHRAIRADTKYESLSEEERAPYANAFRFVDFDAVRAEIAELLADPDGRIARIP